MSSISHLLSRTRKAGIRESNQPYSRSARPQDEEDDDQPQSGASRLRHFPASSKKSKIKAPPLVTYDEPDPDAEQYEDEDEDEEADDRPGRATRNRPPVVLSEDEDAEDDDEYEEEPKANLPVVADGRKRISKLNTKNMRSIMGDAAEDIQQLLEAGENDSATTMMHRRMLQSLVDLLPYAEHNVRKSKGQRGVYQVNSLISSVRELIIDLQSTQDRGQVGALLIERVIRPSYLDIGMAVVQEYATLLADARSLMEPDDYKTFKAAHTESRRRLAESIQAQFGKVKEEATTFMQR